MRLPVRYLIVLSLFVYAWSGCSKDEPSGSTTPCLLSDSSLTGIYRITAATYQADSQAVAEDWFATWDSCDRNIEYQFLPTGEYFEQVEADCGDSFYGLWLLSGNTIKILSLDSTLLQAYPISRFNCSTFTTRDIKWTTGDVFTRTYTRQ